MKKEKKFFNLITKDVPEKEWEAKYLVEKARDITYHTLGLMALIVTAMISLTLLVVLAGTIQCSANLEFEGKGNIVLNEVELPSTLEKFEFKEGKIKFGATVPCSFLSGFGSVSDLYG